MIGTVEGRFVVPSIWPMRSWDGVGWLPILRWDLPLILSVIVAISPVKDILSCMHITNMSFWLRKGRKSTRTSPLASTLYQNCFRLIMVHFWTLAILPTCSRPVNHTKKIKRTRPSSTSSSPWPTPRANTTHWSSGTTLTTLQMNSWWRNRREVKAK